VVIKPAIDLNGHVQVDRYEVPDRLCSVGSSRSSKRRDRACEVARARRDPVTRQVRATSLPRTLHQPGAYLWASPASYWYHVDGTGTLDLGHHGPTGDGFGDPPHP
jgi:hypothetical protein